MCDVLLKRMLWSLRILKYCSKASMMWSCNTTLTHFMHRWSCRWVLNGIQLEVLLIKRRSYSWPIFMKHRPWFLLAVKKSKESNYVMVWKNSLAVVFSLCDLGYKPSNVKPPQNPHIKRAAIENVQMLVAFACAVCRWLKCRIYMGLTNQLLKDAGFWNPLGHFTKLQYSFYALNWSCTINATALHTVCTFWS